MNKEEFEKLKSEIVKIYYNGVFNFGSRRKLYCYTWQSQKQIFLRCNSGKYEDSIFVLKQIDLHENKLKAYISIPGRKPINSRSLFINWDRTNETDFRLKIKNQKIFKSQFDFFGNELKKGDWVYGPKYDIIVFGQITEIFKNEILINVKKERYHFGSRSNGSDTRDYGDIEISDYTCSGVPSNFMKINSENTFEFLMKA